MESVEKLLLEAHTEARDAAREETASLRAKLDEAEEKIVVLKYKLRLARAEKREALEAAAAAEKRRREEATRRATAAETALDSANNRLTAAVAHQKQRQQGPQQEQEKGRAAEPKNATKRSAGLRAELRRDDVTDIDSLTITASAGPSASTRSSKRSMADTPRQQKKSRGPPQYSNNSASSTPEVDDDRANDDEAAEYVHDVDDIDQNDSDVDARLTFSSTPRRATGAVSDAAWADAVSSNPRLPVKRPTGVLYHSKQHRWEVKSHAFAVQSCSTAEEAYDVYGKVRKGGA
mmetsp:Transcript_14144/g.42781  ORF Transcript_14144/g.42781 Transcript_14144/m.42781 type:complete len:291 (+) Transcript_14144:74-946(+)